MEADIQRWREIGATNIFSYPNRKISLHRESNRDVTRAKIDTKYNPPIEKKPERLGKMLDRLSTSYKDDVDIFTKGHLSHSKANEEFEKAKRMVKPKLRFGNTKADEKPPSIGEMIELLEKYDTVLENKKQEIAPVKKYKKYGVQSTNTNPFLMPNTHFSLTKTDGYKATTKLDVSHIKPSMLLKNADLGKKDKLREFREFLDRELALNQCPGEGPDIRRLEVYSACFEKIIDEFTSFGPILSEIKGEYDKTIASFRSDEREFQFLRAKVQKLMAQNENRALLKFEKQKCRELEASIAEYRTKNENMKKDMEYKLSVYAAYLPESVLSISAQSSLAKKEVGKVFEYGKDPISIRDQQIAEREQEIQEKVAEIEELRRAQEKEFVPRITKEKLEENMAILEQLQAEYQKKNDYLETELLGLREQVRSLETSLRDKEQQYQFLVAEYSELSQSLNK